MVVVQVRDDDVLHLVGGDVQRLEAFDDWTQQRPTPLGRHVGAEAGVDDEGAVRPDDGPDEIGERLDDVVQIAAQEVLGGRAIVVRVADRVDLVLAVTH